MKRKVLSILLVSIMVGIFAISMTACGLFGGNSNSNSNENSKNDGRVYLTLDNYEQYLSVSARYFGQDASWSSSSSSYEYRYVVAQASVSSVASYLKFYECVVRVRIVGTFVGGYGVGRQNTC